ncbi:hypothetical protein AS361_05890 [Myroides marinus]|uniref:ComEC/Rec2 family competence protein n=1 Tax=Myroides marinus TaxID=703342 RepID=UPI00074208D9|nr:MBL fold metallo-hydrolase [Myroides marinus]KUF40206.1 hypothetical protein AS361_05890 [Myroides marinus]
MVIKFLKAGTGDCIIISHNSKNLIIDGGNESSFLIAEYNKIVDNKEKIDYLIVTHHDDDHIKGILDLFSEIEAKGKAPQISNIVFNSPRKILSEINKEKESNYLSYRQANELEQYLDKYKDISHTLSLDTTTLDQALNKLFNDKDLKFTVFSPSEETLKTYASNKGVYLTSDNRCDWETPLKKLEQFIDDESQDSSPSNKTSIVLLLTYKTEKYLFTGDITPKYFEDIIDKIKEKKRTVSFKIIKLPHHASYRSLNSSILKKIDCTKFIVSTNSKKHSLPNKKALLKVILNRKTNSKIDFIFNYGEVINNLNLTKEERTKYNFTLLTNNKEEGYVFNI